MVSYHRGIDSRQPMSLVPRLKGVKGENTPEGKRQRCLRCMRQATEKKLELEESKVWVRMKREIVGRLGSREELLGTDVEGKEDLKEVRREE